MKISGFLKNSFIDYSGLIASVVFTTGCNMDCWYCHNRANMMQETVSEAEVFSFLESRRGMVEGVVISGGEPTLQPDLAPFIAKVKELGYKVKLDTNGLNSEVLASLLPMLNYVAMDIKTLPHRYGDYLKSQAGAEKQEEVERVEKVKAEVLKSIRLLIEGNTEYEFRTTVAPELCKNDIVEIAKLIEGARIYYLQQYTYKHLDSKVVGFKAQSYDKPTLRQWAEEASKYTPTLVRGF